MSHPALVLGSTQPLTDVDQAAAQAAGVDVVRRRSGGGAVLVEPGRMVWVDVVVPAGDPLWQPDVGRAFWFLGDAWRAALGSLGTPGATVHRGAPVASRWSALVCFAGLGTGEVHAGRRKIVGMSQRRSRAGALFQCAVPLAWDPAATAALLDLDRGTRARLEAHARSFVAPLAGVTPAGLERALLAHLPTLRTGG